MRLSELIEQLEDLATQHGEEIEVRIAHQPSYPFEYSIGNVVAVDKDAPEDDDDEEAQVNAPLEETFVVYIGEGEQLGYLPGVVSKELGWR